MPRTMFQAAYDNNWTETEGLLLTEISPNIQNTQPTGILSRAFYNTFWYAENPGLSIVELLATVTFGHVALPPWAIATFFGHNQASNFGNKTLGKRLYNTVGWTPLHFAAAGNASKVAQGLILNNADISIKAEDGRTFITIAKELRHTEFLYAVEYAINLHIESMENMELKTKYLAALYKIAANSSESTSQTHTAGDTGDDGSDDRDEEREEELDEDVEKPEQPIKQQSTLRKRSTSKGKSKRKFSM